MTTTPLPWHARAGTVRDADGVIVCETTTEDAARIVAAVNAQAALRAEIARLRGALTATIARIGGAYDWNVDPDGITRLQGAALEEARDAT